MIGSSPEGFAEAVDEAEGSEAEGWSAAPPPGPSEAAGYRRRGRRARITAREGLLLLQAVGYTAVMRIAVWVIPPRYLLRYVRNRVDAVAGASPRSPLSADEIAWTVRAVGRRFPRATCLVQALAAQLLLARNRHHSELRIGVIRDAAGAFTAHAWVVAEGRTVVGWRRGMRYHILPDFAHTLR